ncbi:hypothetical protein GCM10010517_61930 [Streptosporangium fragile]|uniref:Uncharacterized protein n=1 Tax=Streptosporangium fragile TaxID=46186 RepID=A0ABN3W732_9ACTN
MPYVRLSPDLPVSERSGREAVGPIKKTVGPVMRAVGPIGEAGEPVRGPTAAGAGAPVGGSTAAGLRKEPGRGDREDG